MSIPIWQRLFSISLYMIPWNDAIPFGQHLFNNLPLLKILVIPALPIMIIESVLPFSGILIFLGLFIAVVRNSNASYFLRFNAMQVLLISIIISVINYGFQIILNPIQGHLLIRTFSSIIIISTLSIIIFSIIECCQGKEPDLPVVSNAVRGQL